MKNLFLILIIGLASVSVSGQSERLNNKGNFFIGAELGGNIIHHPNVIHSQFGISGEYYFARKWSISAKIKYHKANLYYYWPEYKPSCGFGGFLCGGWDEKLAHFESYNIVIPFNMKWDYKIVENLYGYISGGAFLNIETKSYYNVTDNLEFTHHPIYLSMNIGTGLGYQFKNNDAIYIDYNFYRGGDLIKVNTFLGDKYHYPKNTHISIGYRMNLSK